jgi:2-methylcitrate dehydratase PrpD
LRGLPPLQIAHAIAIAGTTAPSQSATPYTKHRGNSVKEGIPWGAANGVLAANLAAAGFTGPIDILDEPGRYDPATLRDGLGQSWHIDTTYFKPYSACRWLHAPVDALLALMAEHRLAAADIVGIETDTFGRTFTLGNEVAPTTLEGGQYSLPFCLGVAATRGAAALLPMQEESLADADAIAVARRVRMSVKPEFDAMFPAAVPGSVRITTASASFERTVLMPKGEPANPMGWDDIERKFSAVAEPRIGRATANRIRTAIQALQAGDIMPLRTILAAPCFN